MTPLGPLQLYPPYVAGTVFFSILSCFLIAGFSRCGSANASPRQIRKYRLLGSAVLSFTFWLPHFFAVLSVPAGFSTDDTVVFFMVSWLCCGAGSYFSLHFSTKLWINTRQFLIAGTVVAALILTIDYVNILFLFRHELEWKPVLILLNVCIISGASFAILRMLTLHSQETAESTLRKWVYPGILTCGLAMSGFPFICMFSVLKLELFVSGEDSSLAYLLPYLFEIFVLTALYMIPDRYGEDKWQRQAEMLLETQQQYTSLYENNPDGVYAVDSSGCFTHINKQAELLCGYAADQLLGTHFSNWFLPAQKSAVEHYFERVMQGMPSSFETQFLRRDGSTVEILLTVLPIVVRGKRIGAYGIAKDISESKHAQNTIWHLAYHDELTGLPNRRSFRERVEFRLCDSRETGVPFAIIFIDLDRFKKINDLFGHNFGDRIIREAAAKLQRCIGESGTVARMGGDEFTVFIPVMRTKRSLELIAKGIIEEFSRPFEIDGQTVTLPASVGVAIYPRDGMDGDTLMKHADVAMYEAKSSGSNQYRFYEHSMNKADLEQIQLENDLRHAIDNDELSLYYQPKVDMRFGRCTGLEALLRWNHPLLGMVSPAKIIPLAEETGLIVPLELWVLRTACRQVKLWQEQQYRTVPVAVNLSQLHLKRTDIFDAFLRIITEVGIDPQWVELEVTESAMMHNEEHAIRILKQFKQAGLSISMDDFGIGYSSLGYLHSLPIDCLKIDRSFVRDITSKSGSQAIVEMVVSMARQLGLKIIAEGAETEEQVLLLKKLGCHHVQGYYFSRPMPAEQVRRLLEPEDTLDYETEYDVV